MSDLDFSPMGESLLSSLSVRTNLDGYSLAVGPHSIEIGLGGTSFTPPPPHTFAASLQFRRFLNLPRPHCWRLGWLVPRWPDGLTGTGKRVLTTADGAIAAGSSAIRPVLGLTLRCLGSKVPVYSMGRKRASSWLRRGNPHPRACRVCLRGPWLSADQASSTA